MPHMGTVFIMYDCPPLLLLTFRPLLHLTRIITRMGNYENSDAVRYILFTWTLCSAVLALVGNLSVLGSVFLGALAVAPTAVEQATNLTAFRGFAGTSVLILVGVATDTARRVKAELQMQRLAVKSDQFDLE